MSVRKASHFRIIGIHPLNPVETENYYHDFDRANSIHKALIGRYEWFMFYHGIEVDRKSEYINISKDAKKDFSLYDTDEMKISVSAIVGRNGSGKSTIVELIVRAINNFSAVIQGEEFNYSKSEHLHYIDDVYVELLYQIDRKYYMLSVRGRYLSIKEFSWISYYVLKKESEIVLLSEQGEDCRNRILPLNINAVNELKKFFYTLVCNYSLYGFNYRDYYNELTPSARLKSLNINVHDSQICEDAIWLKGLFHKNDGYQTPIVLHPMRKAGQLDIARENKLAKERMLSMLFFRDDSGEYPMRIINGNLNVVEIKYSLTNNNRFIYNEMLKTLEVGSRQNLALNFQQIYNLIYTFWDNKYLIGKHASSCRYYKEACDYLIYKTLKIIRTYKKYNPINRLISARVVKTNDLFKGLSQIDCDMTHVTKKIRQVINYIIAPRFNDYDDCAFVDDFELTDSDKVTNSDNPVLFLPPPIFDTDLILEKELDFINQSGFVIFNPDSSAKVSKVEIGAGHEFNFSGLSSGEKQIAYTTSNILYHMLNVDSEWDDVQINMERKNEVQYKYMNLILDEVELYFHPEMQRCFLFLLLKSIRSIKFKNLRGINILFATHSPFILSDIPGTNILHLNNSNLDLPADLPKTFGGNIMQMLNSSFFMNSSIGEYARIEICKIARFMHKVCNSDYDIQALKNEYKLNKPRYNYILSIMGDQFLKTMTENMIEIIEAKLK